MTTRRSILIYAVLAAVLGVGLVALFLAGPRWLSTPPASESTPAAGQTDARKIRVRLFFAAADGEHLSEVEQEVPYGEGTVEQAGRIVNALLGAPPATHASPVSVRNTARTAVPAGIAETSGSTTGAIWAATISRACSVAPSPYAISRSTLVSRIPSSAT